MFKFKKSTQIDQLIINRTTWLFFKLKQSVCPAWRFHYLGGISACIQLAQAMPNQFTQTNIEKLHEIEKKALAMMTQSDPLIH